VSQNDVIILSEVDMTKGRRAKISEEMINTVVKFLEEGNYDTVAAQAAGISRPTFYRYIRRGKAE
jgi:DNA invertase Pin-like site-specific DNA recombinase